MDSFWAPSESLVGENEEDKALHVDKDEHELIKKRYELVLRAGGRGMKYLPSVRDPRRDQMVQLSFGGCGGMYNYFLGVASVIQEHFHLDNVVFSGSSAGCFPALLLALGVDIQHEFENWNLPLLEISRNRRFKALYHWIPDVKQSTLARLPEDAYERVNYKFFCSVTRIPQLKNELISGWKDNEDMVDCMTASGWIPLFGQSLSKYYRGKHYVDGSMTNNSPVPFDDKPSKVLQLYHWRLMNPAWMYVYTCEEWARKIYAWGVQDALEHLHEFYPLFARKK